MKLIVIFIFLLTTSVYGQKPSGEYHRPTKGGGFTITFNQNGNYKQAMYDCTWGWETKGTWTINNDTVLLNASKMHYRHSKRKIKPDTISTGYNSYNRMKKFLFRNDTLFIPYNNKLKYPMTKRIRSKS
jgi:hypothetical protein